MSSVTEELKKLQEEEPLLIENKHRWVMFPLQYPEIWEMYKKHEASFWTAEEIDLSQDTKDWEKLNDSERHFIKHVLAWDQLGLENHDFSKISKFTKKLLKIYIQFSNLPKIYPKITIAPLRGANRIVFVIFV